MPSLKEGHPVADVTLVQGDLLVEALAGFFSHMPTDTGMTFIVVQHLDPNHESMMVDLLAGHTSMAPR